MASVRDSHEFWREFIELYKQFPSLWQIKSEDYKNRPLKQECYGKLVEKMKDIIPTATKATVTKKINSFRTSYRRELKKVLLSEKSDAGTDDIYQPSLWFYNDLHFLRDQEIQEGGVSTMDSDEEENGNEKSMDNFEQTVGVCRQNILNAAEFWQLVLQVTGMTTDAAGMLEVDIHKLPLYVYKQLEYATGLAMEQLVAAARQKMAQQQDAAGRFDAAGQQFGAVGQQSDAAGQFGAVGQQFDAAGQFGAVGQQFDAAGQFGAVGQQFDAAGQFGDVGQQFDAAGQFGAVGLQYDAAGQFGAVGQQYDAAGQFGAVGQPYDAAGQQFGAVGQQMEGGKQDE
ncbi:uncharacterized protein LOC121856355 [Homarus americanus]|uniref:uncharacterized protein LOC121856355 n=1 Tax=Homarus americanus TaxID=6706 RepID=UPI001C44B130|nr:uncharacterized protein LOC121856355 [Homarus americanus]